MTVIAGLDSLEYYRRKYPPDEQVQATAAPIRQAPKSETVASPPTEVAGVARVALPEGRGGLGELAGLVSFQGRFIAYPSKHAHHAHALWILHSFLVEEFDNTPRIAFLSPEPGSGKSRAMEVTELLVPNATSTVNATPAYIFRKISEGEELPTLLIDEADAIFNARRGDGNEDLRGLLNSGYRKGATAGRAVMRGKEIFTEDFPSFCAVALAGLNDLPETLMQRSIVIPMKRRRKDQKVEPFRRRLHGIEAEAIKQNLEELAVRIRPQVGEAWPELPPGVEDRHADKWEPLIAIADALGGDWPQIARDTALAFVEQSQAAPESVGVRLLSDIRGIIGSEDRIASQDLLDRLKALEESEWATYRGLGLDTRGLSRQLGKYGIKSEALKFEGSTLRGYRVREFADAFDRYLPPIPPGVQLVQLVQPDGEPDAGEEGHKSTLCPIHNTPTLSGQCAQCEMVMAP
jgi:hypothetical protein